MDERQAFGFVTAIGRALAGLPGRDAVAELRAATDPAAVAALVRAAPHALPPERVEDFVATALASPGWEKTRAKLILAIQLARGDIARGAGHESRGAGGVRGRR